MAGKNKITSTDLDLIFSKYKAKGQNKLSFSEFTEALPACAEKKVCTSTRTPELLICLAIEWHERR